MLYILAKILTPTFSFFNLFQYITFRAAGAAITALISSWLLARWVIPWLKTVQFGQVIRQEGPKTHLNKAGTPTMGGVLILLSTLMSIMLWMRLDYRYFYYLLIILLGYGMLGFFDDFFKVKRKNTDGVSPRQKLLLQTVIAAIVAVCLVLDPDYSTQFYLPFMKAPILDLSYFYIPLAILIMVGASNAVNLTDGLDGLAIGISLIVLAVYAVFAYASGHAGIAQYLQVPFSPQVGEVTVFILALMGAGMGFLWYNAHPAQIFMGDVGSLTLGGIIGLLAILVKQEALLVIVGGIFVIEALSVMIQVAVYKRTKKRIFRMAPIHHHFELLGWPETKVVIRFWIISILLALIGLATLKIR